MPLLCASPLALFSHSFLFFNSSALLHLTYADPPTFLLSSHLPRLVPHNSLWPCHLTGVSSRILLVRVRASGAALEHHSAIPICERGWVCVLELGEW
jgi:hypothetical protein